MKLLYIINGLGFSSGMPIGGADKRALEVGNRLLKNHKVEIAVLTTDAGKEILKKEGFKGRYYVIKRPRWWPRFLRNNLLGRALSYFYIVLVSPFKIRTLPPFDIVFPTSDIFFDLVPALSFHLRSQCSTRLIQPCSARDASADVVPLSSTAKGSVANWNRPDASGRGSTKRSRPQSRMVGIVHHHLPVPWKRPGSLVINSLIYLSQRLGFGLFLLGADLVLVPANPEGEEIEKDLEFVTGIRHSGKPRASVVSREAHLESGFWTSQNDKEHRTFEIDRFKNGVDFKAFQEVPDEKKAYEACFLGGLRPSKGIFDLPDIWFEVVKKFPKARLLIIGGGVEKYQKELEKRVREKLLKRNIKLAGVVSQRDLIGTIKSCRIFISPSYEEGWGIVICEALSCGLPVVAYDLPAYEVFGDVVNKIPVGDTGSFSKEIVKLLENERLCMKLSKRGLEVAKKFDWDEISEEELSLLNSILD